MFYDIRSLSQFKRTIGITPAVQANGWLRPRANRF